MYDCFSFSCVKFEESVMGIHFYLGCPIICGGATDFVKEEHFIVVFFYSMYQV